MEHAVIVQLSFQGGEMDSAEEQKAAFALVEELEAAFDTSGIGEYDGEEFGGGGCTFYMYGPDADRLFAAVEPILKQSSLAPGGSATKRYGDAGDPDAREVRIDL
jgi:hypothetical protein